MESRRGRERWLPEYSAHLGANVSVSSPVDAQTSRDGPQDSFSGPCTVKGCRGPFRVRQKFLRRSRASNSRILVGQVGEHHRQGSVTRRDGRASLNRQRNSEVSAGRANGGRSVRGNRPRVACVAAVPVLARHRGQGDPAGAPEIHGRARERDDRGGSGFARLVRVAARGRNPTHPAGHRCDSRSQLMRAP